jgi:hypothetical protein
VIVPVADLRAGETRKVVFRVHVEAPSTGKLDITTVQLGWRRVLDGASRHAKTNVVADVTDDMADVEQTMDVGTIEAVEQINTARAFEEASTVYDTQGADAARQVIQHRLQEVRANKALPKASIQKLEKYSIDADEDFSAAPSGGAAGSKAKKTARSKAYELAK